MLKSHGRTDDIAQDVYYHYTSLLLWEAIQIEGLVPQPVDMNKFKKLVRYYPDNLLQGIYLWPKVNSTLIEDFHLWQYKTKGVKAGVLIKVLLPPGGFVTDTFLPNSKDRINSLCHTLTLYKDELEFELHREVEFNLYLNNIHPSRLSLVKTIVQ